MPSAGVNRRCNAIAASAKPGDCGSRPGVTRERSRISDSPGYFNVDLEIAWSTIQRDLPELAVAVGKIAHG
jgi:hypothetical protein